MTDVAADVVAIIVKRIVPPRPSLELQDKLAELGLDSLSLVELVLDFEEKFDIDIPYNANTSFSDIRTVGDLTSAIQKLVAQKATT
jgi:acyl carrier protein